MECGHEREAIDAAALEVLSAGCASTIDDCALPPDRYFVWFEADVEAGPAVHISPSCRRHRRYCRRSAEAWSRGYSWFGMREVTRDEVSSVVLWMHDPARLCTSARLVIDAPSAPDR